jgi:hypothetical protein
MREVMKKNKLRIRRLTLAQGPLRSAYSDVDGDASDDEVDHI